MKQATSFTIRGSLNSLLLSVIVEGELYIVQGEWIVKRRNYAATLNNMAPSQNLYYRQ